jgi:hypothetical protein
MRRVGERRLSWADRLGLLFFLAVIVLMLAIEGGR